jgi:iron complex outermembrane receptor protein
VAWAVSRGTALPIFTTQRQRFLATSLFAAELLAPAVGAAAPSLVDFDLPAGPLSISLQNFAKKTHLQLLFSSAGMADRKAPALHGRFTPDQALARLIKDSGLDADRTGPTVIVLKPHNSATPISALESPQLSNPNSAETAPAEPGQVATIPATPAIESQPPADKEVVVVGSHIRGVKVTASPTLSITADDMRRQGDATVADALDRLPQNFSGQATPTSAILGSDRAETNAALSQGVNLRGLGASSTLVLVDGHRLAGSGLLGDFADVSSIPTAAVDHVDVLLDGASAIYGSDAVGGVVNIVMKHDFSGAETSVRYGVDAGGVGSSFQLGQTFGVTWDGGHLMAAYDYQNDDAIPASARRYTANADLTGLGGTNHDIIYGSPGNILALNATGTAYVAAYAIPGGAGVGLTPANFIAGSSNLFNANVGTDITPAQERNGFYLDFGQDLDAKTHIDIEGRYNLRVFHAAAPASETILSITDANPHFVSIDGETSDLIGYSLQGAAGPARQSGTDKNFDLSAAVTRDVGRTWKLEAFGGYAEEVGRTFYSHTLNSSNLDEALGNTPDNPATSFSTAADGFFNPYGDGRSNPKAITDFVNDGYSGYVNTSQIASFGLQADGVVLHMPGGDLKGAFGAQYRHERFEPNSFAVDSSSPYFQGGQAFSRDVGAVYGELDVPFVGPDNPLPGIERLDLSLAGRLEHYDDVGSTTNPKIGLVWKPIDDLAMHATYGTSFRAPALSEVGAPDSVFPSIVTTAGNQTLFLVESGGNPALKPQTATTWTAGLDYTPVWFRGLHLGATWFKIDFSNQIAQPGVSNLNTVLTDPAFRSLVTLIDNANPADEAKVQALLAKADPSLFSVFPISAYAAIVDGRYVNAAKLDVGGVDLNGDYKFVLGPNRFQLIGVGSYLYNYAQQQTPTSASEQLLGTAGYPVDFRGRLTLDWARGPYDVSPTLNYVDSYRDPIANRMIASWTTIDLSASWTCPAAQGLCNGLSGTLAVQNLLDQDPPFYDSFLGFGYDPANANPLGRVVSLRLDKRW